MSNQRKPKDFSELQFTDDFMFAIVMRKPHICKKVLEIILDLKISKIEYQKEQESIDLAANAKGIRLDVYAEDDNNTIYNIEMQASVRKNLPKRSRYYQGMIDLNHLEKGMDYTLLKKSYVIFICKTDPFAYNLPMYTFENRCVQQPEFTLADETVKIFLNASGIEGNIGKGLRKLLDYINTGIPGDEFTEELEKEIQKIRCNAKWRKDYMTLEEKYEEKLAEGLAEGFAEGFKQPILNSFKKGKTAEEILDFNDIPLEKVKEIIENFKNEQKL